MMRKAMLTIIIVLFALFPHKVVGGGGGKLLNINKIECCDDGDDDPWKGKNKAPRQNISIVYQPSVITVNNAKSENDITVRVVDVNGDVVLLDVIPAVDTSCFTIYVGNLPIGTYQLILNIDGVDYLYWSFGI